MASRAILASPLAVCLRCQLRSSGFLPYRSLYAARKVPTTRLLPITSRRWNSSQTETGHEITEATAQPLPVEETNKLAAESTPPNDLTDAIRSTTEAISESEPAPPSVEVKEPDSVESPAVESPEILAKEPAVVSAEAKEQESIEPAQQVAEEQQNISSATETEAAEGTPATATVESSTTATTTEEPAVPEPPKKKRGLAHLENRKLLILEMPAPRPRKRPIPAAQQIPDEKVDELSLNLLVFEQESTPDASQFAISLLRPFGVTRVSKLRYMQLYDELMIQFNREQLHSYVIYIRDKIQKDPNVISLKKGMTKASIGALILKDIWGVQIDEEISEREDLIIQKELPMSKEDIYFLLLQNGRNLRKWSQEFHVRITVDVQNSLLRLEAVAANIEALEKRIPEYLATKIYEDIDLSVISRMSQFNKAYSSAIATMTETYIHPITDHIYRVLALGPSAAPIEDARRLIFDSHEIRTRRSYSLTVDSSFSPGAEDSSDLKGALYSAVEDKSLSWMLRGKDWARWRSVKGKVPDLTMSPTQQRISSLIKAATQSPANSKPIDRWEKVKAELDRTDLSEDMETMKALLDDGMSTAPELPPPTYSATLGYVLHNSAMEQRKLNTLQSVLAAGSERVFCENIPGLNYAISNLNILDEAKSAHSWGLPIPEGWSLPVHVDTRINWETGDELSEPAKTQPDEFRKHTLVLNFTPSPWAHPNDFELYPPVEMVLELDPITGEYKNPKVLAIESTSIADLMLPSKECDVRFKRRVDVPLYLGGNAQKVGFDAKNMESVIAKPEEPLQEAHEYRIGEFLKKSQLNPLKEERLRAAPEIELFVPKYVCEAPVVREETEVESAGEDGEAALENAAEQEEVDAAEEVESEGVDAKEELAEEALAEELATEEAAAEEELVTAEEEAETGKANGEENAESSQEPAEEAALDSSELDSPEPTVSAPPPPSFDNLNGKYTPVKYIFSNIAHHTTVNIFYAGYRLQKKYIEAGNSGGKRLEVETFFERVMKPESPAAAPTWGKFTEDVMGLVRKMGIMVRSRGSGVFSKDERVSIDVAKVVRGVQEQKLKKGSGKGNSFGIGALARDGFAADRRTSKVKKAPETDSHNFPAGWTLGGGDDAGLAVLSGFAPSAKSRKGKEKEEKGAGMKVKRVLTKDRESGELQTVDADVRRKALKKERKQKRQNGEKDKATEKKDKKGKKDD